MRKVAVVGIIVCCIHISLLQSGIASTVTSASAKLTPHALYSVTGGSSSALVNNSLAEELIDKLPSSVKPGVTFHLTPHFDLKVALDGLLAVDTTENEQQFGQGDHYLINLSLNGVLVNMKYSF
ncbi:hypothetical protein AVI51_06895 [Piscirickettsia salmonis]|uniref:Uncharacterized protein n=1 Tax=Piscirickettsia salmonis TaxID=1238 RepID=A0A9Q5VLK5_PISSA|nr:hypothetical protein [Piscirickettsia salmonis]ALA25803.1 spore coat protein [Piscirickettsia salmonis]APS43285.1 hypothetical protein AVI48_02090 [Piscirickettsia salmonis]APS46634.1 hypothetical protein AVI49_02695 [Piscirickettsia salmonis]APS50613.1 hypothetical protein AVI50_06980 [Piscirickettsia salmonis]APS53814.1 hypothetical protein AVI51_06895 [Piscirickettsia salmonis]